MGKREFVDLLPDGGSDLADLLSPQVGCDQDLPLLIFSPDFFGTSCDLVGDQFSQGDERSFIGNLFVQEGFDVFTGPFLQPDAHIVFFLELLELSGALSSNGIHEKITDRSW